ncbi:MAG: phosphotransferase family protein, partial [Noviherbaspirillum sp.]
MDRQAICKLLQPFTGKVDFLEEVDAGLFNHVFQGRNEGGGFYFKRFGAASRSGLFPPLPTTPGERFLVAWRCHEHAYRCAGEGGSDVAIPEIIGKDDERHFIVMKAVKGEWLHARLHAAGCDDVRLLDVVCRACAWLGALHAKLPDDSESIREASAAFKRYKVKLQYQDILEWFPAEARDCAAGFIEEYLLCADTLVHGDLNSRNILVDGDRISIIDFEQGHIGEGVYDVAYIVSELVLKWMTLGRHPDEMIGRIWRHYRKALER